MAIEWSILRSSGPVDIAGNFARGYKMAREIRDDISERNALAAYAAHPGDPNARAALYRVNPALAAKLEEADMKRADHDREGEARSALAGWMTGPEGIPAPRGLTGVQPSALTGEMPSPPEAAPRVGPLAPLPEEGPVEDTAVAPDDGLIRQPPMSDDWKRYVEADPDGAMKTLLDRAKLGKEQALALAGQMEWMGRLAQGVTDQASYEQALSVAQSQGFDTSSLPREFDPRVRDTILAQAMSAKDYLKQQHDFTDDEIDNAEQRRHNMATESNARRGQDISSEDRRRGQDRASEDRRRGQDKASEDRRRGQDASGARDAEPRGRSTAVIVNPKTGQRMKLVDGKWVPA